MIALVCMAGTALAQRPGGPPAGRFDIDRMAVLLDLDEYQKSEVARVLSEQRDAGEAMREQFAASGERPSREEIQTHREQMRQDTLAKLQSVLTAEQVTKFEILMERPEGRPRHERGETVSD
jgi:hypothetical protein